MVRKTGSVDAIGAVTDAAAAAAEALDKTEISGAASGAQILAYELRRAFWHDMHCTPDGQPSMEKWEPSQR